MKLPVALLVMVFSAIGAPHAGAAAPVLTTNEYCAGSPLTMGSPFSGGGRIVDIAVIANAHDAAVGWTYAGSLGRRLIQANSHMSPADQAALKVNARGAVSNLHPRPVKFPSDLSVRRCRAAEIARY